MLWKNDINVYGALLFDEGYIIAESLFVIFPHKNRYYLIGRKGWAMDWKKYKGDKFSTPLITHRSRRCLVYNNGGKLLAMIWGHPHTLRSHTRPVMPPLTFTFFNRPCFIGVTSITLSSLVHTKWSITRMQRLRLDQAVSTYKITKCQGYLLTSKLTQKWQF